MFSTLILFHSYLNYINQIINRTRQISQHLFSKKTFYRLFVNVVIDRNELQRFGYVDTEWMGCYFTEYVSFSSIRGIIANCDRISI